MNGPCVARRLLIVALLAGALVACGANDGGTDAAGVVPSVPELLPAADRSTSTTATSTTSTSTTAASTPTSTSSPTSSPTSSTAPLSEEERVGAAQRLLLAHGYAIGEIDGDLGPATTAALADFQTNHGLAATGALDGPTFTQLERSGGALSVRLPASVVVDLSEQQLRVYNAAGEQVSSWPISTGGPGNETPTGSFAVQARQRVGTAKDAETVHMDYFTVFNGNIGFHGIPWVGSRDDRLWTPLGEYGVSHGCIRMDDANALYLYTFLADGAPVTVQD